MGCITPLGVIQVFVCCLVLVRLKTMYLGYSIVVWCMVFIVFMIDDMGICRFLSPSMLFIRMARRTHVVITYRGLAFHPSIWMAFISGLYKLCLVCMAWRMYLLCVNVRFTICMERLGV